MNHACPNQDQTPIEECLDCKREKFIDELESKLRIAESAIAYKNEINSQLEYKLRIAEDYFKEILHNDFTPEWMHEVMDNRRIATEALQKIRGEGCVE
jgi:hypothetical protein